LGWAVPFLLNHGTKRRIKRRKEGSTKTNEMGRVKKITRFLRKGAKNDEAPPPSLSPRQRPREAP